MADAKLTQDRGQSIGKSISFSETATTKLVVRQKVADSMEKSLWEEAYRTLDKSTSSLLPSADTDPRIVPTDILNVVNEKKEESLRKRWKFKRSNGEELVLRDIFERIVESVNKFKRVGDLVVQYDPAHAALPWAAARFLLIMSISDVQMYASMIAGVEKVSRLIARYAGVEADSLRGCSPLKTDLKNTLIGFYGKILGYLGRAREYYGQKTRERFVRSLFQVDKLEIEEEMEKILGDEKDVHNLIMRVEAENQKYRTMGIMNAVQEVQHSLKAPQVPIEERRSRLQQWLRATYTDGNYSNALSLRHENTCNWIFEAPQFISWVSPCKDKAKIFWVHGPPGFGKTVLCATLISYLAADHSNLVASFFCVSEDEAKQEPYAIVRSWIAQLVQQNVRAVELAENLYRSTNMRTPTVSELWIIFHTICREVANIFLVIDGFDECTYINKASKFHTSDGRLKFIKELIKEVAGSNVHVLLVSRDISDIRKQKNDHLWSPKSLQWYEYGISQKDTVKDVQLVSFSIINSKLASKRQKLREELANDAAKRADGMFLWLQLLREQLNPIKNANQLRLTVSEMPEGVDQQYEKDLNRLMSLKDEERERGVAILRWVFFAVRPLTVGEITEALLLRADDTARTYPLDDLPDSWDENKVDEHFVSDTLLAPCGSLIELRSPMPRTELASMTVHFVHFSVKEYLLHQNELGESRMQQICFSDSVSEHSILARLCLQYLCYDVFGEELGKDKPIEVSETRRRKLERQINIYPFLKYAARYWSEHASHNSAMTADILFYAKRLFDPAIANWGVWRDVFDFELDTEFDYQYQNFKIRRLEGLNGVDDVWGAFDKDVLLTYHSGLGSEMKKLSDVARPMIATHSPSAGPLYYACSLGMADLVEALLQQGSDCNILGGRYGSPLIVAIVNNKESIVELLLEHGANVNQRGGPLGRSPILWAADTGSETIFKMLANAGAAIHCSDDKGHSCLHLASYGASRIVSILLDEKVDINQVSDTGKSALYQAIFGMQTETVNRLLEAGIRLSTKDNNGDTPLHSAIAEGNQEIVELLINRGADIEARNGRDRRPIHFAAALESDSILGFLVSQGAQIDTTDMHGWSALHIAVWSGAKSAITLLLNHCADINCFTDQGFTALHMAVEQGSQPFLTLLVGNDANIETRNVAGSTALLSAIVKSSISCAKTLLDHGADILTESSDGSTPLDLAIRNKLDDAMLLLVENGSLCVRRDPEPAADVQNLTRKAQKLAFLDEENSLKDLIEAVNTRDFQQVLDNVFHAAVFGGSERIVKYLLERGALINSKEINGRTPLHLAASRGFLDLTKFLLERGANAQAKDSTGSGALSTACYFGLCNLGTVDYLSRYGTLAEDDDARVTAVISQTANKKLASRHIDLSTFAGRWEGSYRHRKWRKGKENPTSIYMEFDAETPGVFFGKTKDYGGGFQIRGHLHHDHSIWFAKLYGCSGWIYSGKVDSIERTMVGHWGRSTSYWHGTFKFKQL